MRLRRIWVADIGARDRAVQLTSDSRYRDEEPVWSHDASHILFCRIDANNARTIWLMRHDGSELRQVAGPLAPPPNLSDVERLIYGGFYGYTDWRSRFDWWRGP